MLEQVLADEVAGAVPLRRNADDGDAPAVVQQSAQGGNVGVVGHRDQPVFAELRFYGAEPAGRADDTEIPLGQPSRAGQPAGSNEIAGRYGPRPKTLGVLLGRGRQTARMARRPPELDRSQGQTTMSLGALPLKVPDVAVMVIGDWTEEAPAMVRSNVNRYWFS